MDRGDLTQEKEELTQEKEILINQRDKLYDEITNHKYKIHSIYNEIRELSEQETPIKIKEPFKIVYYDFEKIKNIGDIDNTIETIGKEIRNRETLANKIRENYINFVLENKPDLQIGANMDFIEQLDYKNEFFQNQLNTLISKKEELESITSKIDSINLNIEDIIYEIKDINAKINEIDYRLKTPSRPSGIKHLTHRRRKDISNKLKTPSSPLGIKPSTHRRRNYIDNRLETSSSSSDEKSSSSSDEKSSSSSDEKSSSSSDEKSSSSSDEKSSSSSDEIYEIPISPLKEPNYQRLVDNIKHPYPTGYDTNEIFDKDGKPIYKFRRSFRSKNGTSNGKNGTGGNKRSKRRKRRLVKSKRRFLKKFNISIRKISRIIKKPLS